VAAVIEAGRAAWPELAVPPAVVEEHLARLGAAAEIDLGAAGDGLLAHAADLLLAAACAHGLPAALAQLERGPLREIDDFVSRIDSSPAFGQEVRQLVRAKLLVGGQPGQPGKIAEYAGRGPLGGWVRVVAVRTALDLRRARGQEPSDATDADRVAAIALDPETRLLRDRHRGPFAAALADALGALSVRERNVLRLHFAEGWTLEQLATSYQVHRATVSRWLASAREAVLAGVARRLGESVGMTPDEIVSVVRLLGSEIDVSLSRLR
jgi:RNA polymerase sigma-70 factor (ECF subfamily)